MDPQNATEIQIIHNKNHKCLQDRQVLLSLIVLHRSGSKIIKIKA